MYVSNDVVVNGSSASRFVSPMNQANRLLRVHLSRFPLLWYILTLILLSHSFLGSVTSYLIHWPSATDLAFLNFLFDSYFPRPHTFVPVKHAAQEPAVLLYHPTVRSECREAVYRGRQSLVASSIQRTTLRRIRIRRIQRLEGHPPNPRLVNHADQVKYPITRNIPDVLLLSD